MLRLQQSPKVAVSDREGHLINVLTRRVKPARKHNFNLSCSTNPNRVSLLLARVLRVLSWIATA